MLTIRRGLSALALAALLGMAARAAAPAAPGDGKVLALELDAGAAATLQSIRKFEEDFYAVDYLADYALDEALAAGMEDQKALEAFASRKLMGGLPFNFEVISFACSTFAAAMPDGDFIQGRNMDLSYAKNFLVRTRPKGGYESLSMVSGHLLGYQEDFPESGLGRLWTLAAPYFPLDGINEMGLSVAILLVEDTPVRQDTGKPPLTTTLAVRLALDKAATVDEALALLARHDMRSIANSNYHFHFADAAGDSAVVEYVHGEMSVVRSTGYGHPVTNYYLSPGMYDVVIDGQDRVETLQKALDDNRGVVDAERAWRMLDSVKAVHDYDEVNDIDYMTAYSVLYNNSRRGMDICIDMKFDTVYRFKVGYFAPVAP